MGWYAIYVQGVKVVLPVLYLELMLYIFTFIECTRGETLCVSRCTAFFFLCSCAASLLSTLLELLLYMEDGGNF